MTQYSLDARGEVFVSFHLVVADGIAAPLRDELDDDRGKIRLHVGNPPRSVQITRSARRRFGVTMVFSGASCRAPRLEDGCRDRHEEGAQVVIRTAFAIPGDGHTTRTPLISS